MNIYSPSQEDLYIFESLKYTTVDETVLEPIVTVWPKGEYHPMWGVKRPELSARNRLLKGTKWSKEIPHFNIGKKHSEETKAKMRESSKNRPKESIETRLKRSEAAKKKMSDPAHKALIANKRKIPVILNGIQYESIKEAKEKLGLHYRKIKALLEACQ